MHRTAIEAAKPIAARLKDGTSPVCAWPLERLTFCALRCMIFPLTTAPVEAVPVSCTHQPTLLRHCDTQ